MKFEVVLFEVMRAVTINCKLTWPGLTNNMLHKIIINVHIILLSINIKSFSLLLILLKII